MRPETGFTEPPSNATVPDLLERAAASFPRRGISIFDGRGRRSTRRRYPEVLAAARQAAGRWASLGVEREDRILISQPTSWPLIETWLGAVLMGALPVAVAPGAALGGGRAHVRKVAGLVDRLGCRFALVGPGFRREVEQAIQEDTGGSTEIDAEAQAALHGVAGTLLSVEDFEAASATSFDQPAPSSEATAFLQLTSGSTGFPRAVRIPHRAALHNARASDRAIGVPHGAPVHEWAERMVSWLPLHHDMGLIGCFLLSVYAGFDLSLFQGTTFLARPRLWLEHLGGHGVAFAPAPNFGYQLCLERLEASDRQGLDLSSWRAAMTGAEMVRPETVHGFCDAFAANGFRPEVFRPCFGLAEATLSVTFDTRGKGLRTRPLPRSAGAVTSTAKQVACVGEAIEDTRVVIAAADGRPVAEGEIGEVRVQGPSVFSGYWNDPQATAESLEDGWLRTGDLGFIHDGELYLTGRTKDILIIRGHNMMPHEIEWLAEGVSGGGGALRSGAFSVADGGRGEQAVVVVETAEKDVRKLGSMAGEIRRQVGKNLSLTLADVAFVRRGKIPKTTSGKVQRRQLRDQYMAGELNLIGRFEA